MSICEYGRKDKHNFLNYANESETILIRLKMRLKILGLGKILGKNNVDLCTGFNKCVLTALNFSDE